MEYHFPAIPHDDVLALLITILLLLFVARALGEIAQRLGQPAVVGEILAGIVLGPSLLSGFVPTIGVWVLPQTAEQSHMLDIFSLLGALFMLLITGLEIDLVLIRRQARSAIGVAIGGLLLPFISGFMLAATLPDHVLIDPSDRLVFILFLATAMSVSAIPVIAKVLIDLNLMRRNIGQIIISAGMIDDAIAWILLSVVVGIAGGSSISIGSVAGSIGSMVGLILVSMTLGRWFVVRVLDFVQDEIQSRDAMLTAIVILMLLWSAMSHALHLEPMVGAFLIGILLGQMRNLPNSVIHKLESIALGIFAPVFFAIAGLKVNVLNLFHPRLAILAVVVIIVACGGKIVGAYLGARLVGKCDHWTALSCGMALNARGAVGIIIATIGLSLNILSQDMFSIIVVMAIVTSLIAPIALRWTVAHIQPDKQEIERLHHEELIHDNPFAYVHRVLLPIRRRTDNHYGPIQAIEAHLLKDIGTKHRLAITLLNVANDRDRIGSTEFLNQVGQIFRYGELTKKVIMSSDPVNAILDEAKKGYDLMVMGSTGKQNGTEILFNPIVDSLVRLSRCPSIVIHSEHVVENWCAKRILVPTSGSLSSRRAVHAAFSLASAVDGEVLILKVVNVEATVCYLDSRENILERQYIIAHQIVDELAAMGLSLGVQTYPAVLAGSNPENVILDVAKSNSIDLIMLGTRVRAGSKRLYMGSRVESILYQAPCPVIIVNSVL